MYEFLSLEKGTLVARNVVTKMLNEYIKSNNLRLESDKRKILPDEKLKKIFNCSDNADVTYFNLQTHIKDHFIKKDAVSKAKPAQPDGVVA
jgi:upstream activation factor subunit UAF30